MADGDITCGLPSANAQSTSKSPVFCVAIIKLAQMTSQITSKLSKFETTQQSPEKLLETISVLESQIAELKYFLQQFVDLESPLDAGNEGVSLTLQQAIYIRMAYYIAVFDVHTTLTYPWSRKVLLFADKPEIEVRVRHSETIVAKTARNAIQATQFLRLNAATSLL